MITSEQVLAGFDAGPAGQPVPRVHALTPPEGVTEPVNIARQQLRAHNLAWALSEIDREEEGWTCVVGGGFAGLTCAVALALAGRPTVLFEQSGRLLFAQWKSYDRYLHPVMFDWPDGSWRDTHTRHPALAWEHHFAAAVREIVLRQVPSHPRVPLRIEPNVFVREITPAGDGVNVGFVAPIDEKLVGAQCEFGRVVIASGFPMERAKYGALGGSYWRTPTDAASIPGDGGVRIVGNGDGALTELVTLGVAGFRQDHLRDLVHLVDSVAPGLHPVGPDRWTHFHDGLPEEPVASALGGAATSFPMKLFSKDVKLAENSFLVNTCAAVAVEQAREARGLPKVFEDPVHREYDGTDAAEDHDKNRTIVWRVGPRDNRHLIRDFGLPCRPAKHAADRLKEHWPPSFDDKVTTDFAEPRRLESQSPIVPTGGVELELAFNGPLVEIGKSKTEYADVAPALHALGRAALKLGGRDEAIDISAVRIVDDGTAIHAAVDAIGAVASLPAAVVVDALLAAETPVWFADRCLYVRLDATSLPSGPDPGLDTVALHVAADGMTIEAALTARRSAAGAERAAGADLIDKYLDDDVLIEALMLALRARRRRVTLPTAALTRLQRRKAMPGERQATSRLLRLIAIAIVPGTARSQGRIGLVRLGRATARQTWIRNDLAAFFYGADASPERAERLPAELLLNALRPIGSPLRGTQVLALTRTVLELLLPAIAPARGEPAVDLGDGAVHLARALRGLLEEQPPPGADLAPFVDGLLESSALTELVEEASGDGTMLRTFGLQLVPAEADRKYQVPTG